MNAQKSKTVAYTKSNTAINIKKGVGNNKII